ncbi:acyltransferase [Acinetobacter vivianii]|uniref:acyltransferase family protein n=1 Tax=Acinetobacter vivianii TaxID=1776742 RepID=UPI002DB95920|nr:acyltransferase family protein [Acinetobacter vivianii]MEB6667410.1 acyltransferase [Acinetobacter vivianii]
MQSSTPLRLDIQGLRAVAVLAVIIFHVNKEWLPSGFIGVDIFFVISGFIISSIILNNNKNFSFLNFYKKRIIRIIPAYLLLLSICAIVSIILLTLSDLRYFLESLKYTLYFYSNHYFSTFGDYFSPMSEELPLLHTWSLAIEMQFYFILPILLTFFSRKKFKEITIILIVLLTLWVEIKFNRTNEDQYFSLLSRIPEFLVGTLAALLARNPIIQEKKFLSLIGIFILLPCFFLIPNQHFPGVLGLIPSICIALIIIQKDSFINKILERKSLVFIGTISYSLYLWHWPILAFFRYYKNTQQLTLPTIIIAISLTFFCAYISYIFIENKLSKCKAIYIYLFIIANLIILSFVLFFGEKINKKITPEQPIYLTRYADDKKTCHGKIIERCLKPLIKDHSILVIGDSHAAQLNIYFDTLQLKSSYSFNIISSSSCLPIQNFNINSLPTWARASCTSQTKVIESKLNNHNTIIIAGLWSKHFKDQQSMTALDNFIEKNKVNHRIIILGQIPTFTKNINRIQHFQNLHLNPKISIDPLQMKANVKLKEISQRHDIEFINFSNNYFFNNAPKFNDKFIYYDSNHLNELGSKYYAEATGNELLNVLNKLQINTLLNSYSIDDRRQ